MRPTWEFLHLLDRLPSFSFLATYCSHPCQLAWECLRLAVAEGEGVMFGAMWISTNLQPLLGMAPQAHSTDQGSMPLSPLRKAIELIEVNWEMLMVASILDSCQSICNI